MRPGLGIPARGSDLIWLIRRGDRPFWGRAYLKALEPEDNSAYPGSVPHLSQVDL